MAWIEKLDDTLRRREYYQGLSELFASSTRGIEDKLADFAMYVPNNAMARFLVRYELMKLIVHVPGSVV